MAYNLDRVLALQYCIPGACRRVSMCRRDARAATSTRAPPPPPRSHVGLGRAGRAALRAAGRRAARYIVERLAGEWEKAGGARRALGAGHVRAAAGKQVCWGWYCPEELQIRVGLARDQEYLTDAGWRERSGRS